MKNKRRKKTDPGSEATARLTPEEVKRLLIDSGFFNGRELGFIIKTDLTYKMLSLYSDYVQDYDLTRCVKAIDKIQLFSEKDKYEILINNARVFAESEGAAV